MHCPGQGARPSRAARPDDLRGVRGGAAGAHSLSRPLRPVPCAAGLGLEDQLVRFDNNKYSVSVRLASQNREVIPRIVYGCAAPITAWMLRHDAPVLADHDALGEGVDVDRVADDAGAIVGAGRLAPHAVQGCWQHRILERRAVAQSVAWAYRCLRDIVNVMSRQRRKDWHSVRKGACVWIFRRREGAVGQTLSPGDRADPGLASVRGLDWLGPIEDAKGAFMSIKLTDTQLVLLGAAAQRKDLCLVAPPTLKGATAREVANKLISACLVKEVKAKASDPIWRRDEESRASYALKLTTAGAKAIAVEDAADPEDAGEESATLANRDQAAILSKLDAKDARPAEAMEPSPAGPSAPRGGSKLARVLLRCLSAIMARPLRN
jgi:hypothetical protein